MATAAHEDITTPEARQVLCFGNARVAARFPLHAVERRLDACAAADASAREQFEWFMKHDRAVVRLIREQLEKIGVRRRFLETLAREHAARAATMAPALAMAAE